MIILGISHHQQLVRSNFRLQSPGNYWVMSVVWAVTCLMPYLLFTTSPYLLFWVLADLCRSIRFSSPVLNGSRLHLLHAGKRGWTHPMFMEIFVTSAWSVWKERNGKIFKRVPPAMLPGEEDSRRTLRYLLIGLSPL